MIFSRFSLFIGYGDAAVGIEKRNDLSLADDVQAVAEGKDYGLDAWV